MARKLAGDWGPSPGWTGQRAAESRSVWHELGARRRWGRGRGLAAAGRYLLHDVAVAVAGSQVQWGIVTAVHDVDACPPHDEHVNHVGAALAAGPVQGAEAMVIPVETAGTALLSSSGCPCILPGLGSERRARPQHRSQAGIACAPAHGPRGEGDRLRGSPTLSHPRQGPGGLGQIPFSPGLNHREEPDPLARPPRSARPSKGGGHRPGLKRRSRPGRRGPLHGSPPPSPHLPPGPRTGPAGGDGTGGRNAPARARRPPASRAGTALCDRDAREGPHDSECHQDAAMARPGAGRVGRGAADLCPRPAPGPSAAPQRRVGSTPGPRGPAGARSGADLGQGAGQPCTAPSPPSDLGPAATIGRSAPGRGARAAAPRTRQPARGGGTPAAPRGRGDPRSHAGEGGDPRSHAGEGGEPPQPGPSRSRRTRGRRASAMR